MRPGAMSGGDGYNYSSYGSVCRMGTPGVGDVSTHDYQLSHLDNDDWHQVLRIPNPKTEALDPRP